MEPMKGKWDSSLADLGTLSYFAFLRGHQCLSRLVILFLVTLWCSIKKIEVSFVFDWEYGIALQTMQGNRASSPAKGVVSWDFLSCGRNLGYILELQRGWPFETPLG